MTSMTYLFGDLLTGEVLEEISLYGTSLSLNMDGGELRGTFQYDQTGKMNETLEAATQPGRNFVVAERDGHPVWGGIVWTRTYQSQSKTEQLYCRTFDAYADRRIIDFDYSSVNVEQTQLFLTLYELMQADTSAVKIELPAPLATGIGITLEVKGAEYKTYRQVLSSISDTDVGFDWTIDVVRDGGSYRRVMRLGFPNLGSPWSTTSPIFDYPGNISNYYQNESMAESGTHIYGIGAGEGETMVVSTVIHGDVLNGGFPRYDNDFSMKDIASQAILDSQTAIKANILRPPMPIITVELKADRNPEFGSYSIGDACTLIFDDPKHPNRFIKQTSIIGWEYTPQSDDSEEKARLIFEGDDLA